jgi:glycosyltransferase involved in cell wall biosynthesis
MSLPDSSQNIDISVIVPVYNHWHLIPRLIDCLARQSIGCRHFELLLVDNGSTDFSVPEDFPGWARVLECREPGSYAARNRAVAETRGQLLAFTDADCLPEPGWLAALHAEFARSTEQLVIAGSILVEPECWASPLVYELYDVALGLPQKRYATRRGYGVTANLAMSKLLFERLTGFDAGRFSGGDAEFCRRATAAGARLAYCEAAVVLHPARQSWSELSKKVRRIKGGQIRSGSLRQRTLFAVRTLLPPFRAWLLVLGAGRLSGWQRTQVCVIQLGLWGVELLELGRLLAGGTPKRA